MNIMEASHMWATVPPDGRHWSIRDMHAAWCDMAERSKKSQPLSLRTLSVRAEGERGLFLNGTNGREAVMTNFGFVQLASRVGAPASFLAELPAPMAAEIVNYRLQTKAEETPTILLLKTGEVLTLRGVCSTRYGFIPNRDVTQRLLQLPEYGWRVPPARPAFPDQPGTRPATEDDVLLDREGGGGLSIKVGDLIAPAGLYSSFDRGTIYAFMVNEVNPIDDGAGNMLSRGVIISNAEVPGHPFRVRKFGYEHVCGNHIIWSARDLGEIRVRHVGKTVSDRAFTQLRIEMMDYVESSASKEEQAIRAARSYTIAATKEEVLDTIFGMKWCKVPRKTLELGYDAAELTYDIHKAAPNTAWGMVQGLTRVSQETAFVAERSAIDGAAGRLAELAF